MINTLEELRAMAVKLLESQENNVALSAWGNNVKDLLQELSIYHVELEHQNEALEQSEKDLAKAHAEYVELFENAPVGYVVIDESRVIRKVNLTFVNSFVPIRARSEQLEGRAFDEFVCPEFRSTFELFCKMLQKPGIPVPVEMKLLDRFGKPHYVLLTAGERKAESRMFRLTVSDIALQKKLEAQLVKAKDEAEEHDRQKSLFLTSVSHELRTPLTTMIGFSDMLADPLADRTAQKECIASIQSSGKMLMTLTDEILDLSVLESGVVPLRGTNTDIQKICDETALLIQRKNIAKNILIRSELDDIPILWMDATRLRQAMFAILEHAAGNALGGTILIRGRFELETDNTDGMLILTISGTNIFSGESSLEMDIRRNPVSQNCAGLGLFLAKQIIKAMNGRMVWVHPLDSMRLEIPLKVSDHIESEAKPNDVGAFDSGTIRKCLLVDDVVLNLKVLAAMMKKMHYEPALACSGKEALTMMARQRFDLVMTDLWMPEMSGEELAVTIRQNPDYDNIPIVAVTADVEREKNFDMEFFAATVIKPVNLEKLDKLFQKQLACVSAPDSETEKMN